MSTSVLRDWPQRLLLHSFVARDIGWRISDGHCGALAHHRDPQMLRQQLIEKSYRHITGELDLADHRGFEVWERKR